MPIFIRKSLLLFGLLVTPMMVSAANDPASHHHGDDQTMKKGHHDGHQSNLMSADEQGHDHGAHEWVAPEEEQQRPNPIAATEESINTGLRLYRHYCITCHGYEADGTGMHGQNLNPEPANLRDMVGHHTDGDYHWKIRTGHGPMPDWGTVIRTNDIWHLVNYLQSLTPQNPEASGHGAHKH